MPYLVSCPIHLCYWRVDAGSPYGAQPALEIHLLVSHGLRSAQRGAPAVGSDDYELDLVTDAVLAVADRQAAERGLIVELDEAS